MDNQGSPYAHRGQDVMRISSFSQYYREKLVEPGRTSADKARNVNHPRD